MAKRSDTAKTALDPLFVAVGERVVGLREAAGMSAQELAAAAGMDPNYLWRIERGRQNLSLRNVARLARALGLGLSDLFVGVELGDVELESRAYVRKAQDGRAD